MMTAEGTAHALTAYSAAMPLPQGAGVEKYGAWLCALSGLQRFPPGACEVHYSDAGEVRCLLHDALAHQR